MILYDKTMWADADMVQTCIRQGAGKYKATVKCRFALFPGLLYFSIFSPFSQSQKALFQSIIIFLAPI